MQTSGGPRREPGVAVTIIKPAVKVLELKKAPLSRG